jgi:membrane protein DedA with SNARE-associated domain
MTEWVMNYIVALGLGGIFLGVIIESMGIPFFPGGIMVILAGFLSSQGKFPLFQVFLVTFLGLNIGSVIAYLIGIKIGEPFLFRFGKLLRITPQRLKNAQVWAEQSSAAFIIFGRFIPTVSNLTPYLAGISGLGILKFTGFNLIFAAIWSLFNLGIGIFFGHNWKHILHLTRFWLPVLAGCLLVLSILVLMFKKTRLKI